MDYNTEAPGEVQQYTVQYQYMGYPPVYRRLWFWILLLGALICTAVITVLLACGGGPQRPKLTGNAGVVAAYDFFNSQQTNQEKLTSPAMKELGERLKQEPFEIEGEIKVSPEDRVESFFSLSDIAIGLEAKYDMKDFGVKVRALGTEFIGAYLIEDNIVVSMIGRAGSFKLNLPDGVKPEKNMGLQERIDSFLPFLPDDEVYLSLLEKFAHAVPDKYTAADTVQAYSPKDYKEVRMEVITTTLDSQAIKEVITGFAEGIKSDRKLLRQLQDIIDKFTSFAGNESYSIDDFIKELEGPADSEALKDIRLSWSVYSRHGNYVGISLEFSAKDTDFKYTYMCEYDGSNSFTYTASEVNGTKEETKYEYNWQGNKLKMSGEMDTIVSEDTGNTTQLIDVVMECSKNGGNEYAFACDFTIKGDIYNDILNSQGGRSYGMKVDAAVKLGGGLGTLKGDRDWNDIYDKEWGSMEDIFGWKPGRDFFDYDTGNNL